MKHFSLLTAGAVVAAAIVAAAPASAATFALGNIAVPPTQPVTLNNTVSTAGVFQDLYTFTLTSATALATSGFQTTRLDMVSNIDFTSAILYFGTGTGGAVRANYTRTGEDSQGQETEALGTTLLTAGAYTIALNGTATAVPASYQGQITFAAAPSVPEAATWAMMVVGFGVAGAGMRSSRRKNAIA